MAGFPTAKVYKKLYKGFIKNIGGIAAFMVKVGDKRCSHVDLNKKVVNWKAYERFVTMNPDSEAAKLGESSKTRQSRLMNFWPTEDDVYGDALEVREEIREEKSLERDKGAYARKMLFKKSKTSKDKKATKKEEEEEKRKEKKKKKSKEWKAAKKEEEEEEKKSKERKAAKKEEEEEEKK